MVAVVSHRLDAESLASTEKNSLQSRALVTPPDTAVQEAKCVDLEKVVIGGDSEKFFGVGA